MNILCLFAHPDDETVACGGTLKLLSNKGHTISVVLATTGQAGNVYPSLQKKAKQLGGVEQLRRLETKKACQILGINQLQFLSYQDGQINNQQAWGSLTIDFSQTIDKYQPDLLITFDHTGWYYHLDHVAVSIATSRAIDKSKHKPTAILFNLFHPPGIKDKWPYDYPVNYPISHTVNIKSVIPTKIKAIKAHASQNINLIKPLQQGHLDQEWFKLFHPTQKAIELLKVTELFHQTNS